MSCICENIIKIPLFVSPSDTGIDTTVVAPVSGNYKLLIEFNGTYLELILTCTATQRIILPNALNGEYSHLTQIYAPDGTLLNNTCYCFIVRTITTSNTSINPNPRVYTMACSIQVVVKDSPDGSLTYTLCDGGTIPLQYPTGNTVVIPHLIGLYVQRPIFINNQPDQTIPFDTTTGTLDNTANGGFQDGDIITINYAQPIS